jgi:hypothetical protein
MKRDAQKINCTNHAGNIAKGEKAAELGLERLCEQIHCKHGIDNIRENIGVNKIFWVFTLFISAPFSLFA